MYYLCIKFKLMDKKEKLLEALPKEVREKAKKVLDKLEKKDKK